MLQILPKWRLMVTFATGTPYHFEMSDTHLSNVLRKFADLGFPTEVRHLEIVAVMGPETQTATQTEVTTWTQAVKTPPQPRGDHAGHQP